MTSEEKRIARNWISTCKHWNWITELSNGTYRHRTMRIEELDMFQDVVNLHDGEIVRIETKTFPPSKKHPNGHAFYESFATVRDRM